MFHYVSEDPWPISAFLAALAFVFLVLLRTRQDGRDFLRMLACLAMIGILLIVERVWVTENERVEQVVAELIDALSHSDGDRAAALFAPEITIGVSRDSQRLDLDRNAFRALLSTITFDWLRISRLTTHAGAQTRQGSAEFRVSAGGSARSPLGVQLNFATPRSDWSLGLRKFQDGGWKITRITPISVPFPAEHAIKSFISRISQGSSEAPRIPSPLPGPQPIREPIGGRREGRLISPRAEYID
ncbi:MAG: hypothetical protein SFX72_01185 [Isosphaeraceae bacterium]|nr:hypothetical protein [Isosphaeraceae bacterium]